MTKDKQKIDEFCDKAFTLLENIFDHPLNNSSGVELLESYYPPIVEFTSKYLGTFAAFKRDAMQIKFFHDVRDRANLMLINILCEEKDKKDKIANEKNY